MTADQACAAIRATRPSPREAAEMVAFLQQRIADSNWGHTELAQNVRDSLTDAHYLLEVAAEHEAEPCDEWMEHT